MNYRSWIAVKEQARKLTAEMIGARPEQIAFMRNTSDGIQYASGFRAYLERIRRAARSHEALLVVDVILALEVTPTNVEAELIDVAPAAEQKWLLTPEGVGLLYLPDRARERLEPTLVVISVPNPEDYGDFEQGWNRGALAWETNWPFSADLWVGSKPEATG